MNLISVEFKEIIFLIPEDNVSIYGSSNGKQQQPSNDGATKNEPVQGTVPVVINSPGSSSETMYSETETRLLDSHVLLCCEDALLLYSTKSVIQVCGHGLVFSIFSCTILVFAS